MSESIEYIAPKAKLVLAIDDDPMVLAMIEFILDREGWSLKTAEDGKAAEAALNSADFDLILLDFQLPDTDGKTLLTLIRKHPRAGSTPVVMLTAGSESSLASECIGLGAAALVRKPFTPDSLVEAIRPVIETPRA